MFLTCFDTYPRLGIICSLLQEDKLSPVLWHNPVHLVPGKYELILAWKIVNHGHEDRWARWWSYLYKRSTLNLRQPYVRNIAGFSCVLYSCF